MTELVPTRGTELAVPAPPRQFELATIPDQRRPVTERLLAFGALTVSVVENTAIGGHSPGRYTVVVGGRAVETIACGYDRDTGRRWVQTSEVGLVIVPSAEDRRRGGCLTVNGMAIPGS